MNSSKHFQQAAGWTVWISDSDREIDLGVISTAVEGRQVLRVVLLSKGLKAQMLCRPVIFMSR